MILSAELVRRRSAWSLYGGLLATAALAIPVSSAAARPGDVVEPGAPVQAQPAPGVAPAQPQGPQSSEVPRLVPHPGQLRRAKAAAARKLRRSGIPAAARPGELLSPTPRASIFNGLNQAGLGPTNSSPPDTTGAIGPTHYVEMVNTKIGVFDRTNLNPVSSAEIDAFTGFSGNNVFDPQIQWDPTANRWFYVADRVVARGDNHLAFGWSKTADPSDLTTGWCRFSIPTGDQFDDYPKLGHNNNHIILGTNVFDDSLGGTGGFLTAHIWAIPKPANGDTSCPTTAPTATPFGSAATPLRTADSNLAFTPEPANTFDSSANGYIVAADFPGSGSANQVMAWHISGAAATPSLTQDGNMSVTPYSVPANVPQPSSTNVLDSSDTRLTQAVAHADPGAGGAEAVWTQHTVAGAGGRSAVRWYELLPASLTVRQQGTISDPAHFVFNGAISPALNGSDAAVEYNLGSATQLVQIRAQSRQGGDSLSSMGGEVTLGTSSAANQDFTCTPCRWGDYAGASPDPNNPNVVWGSNQLNGPVSGPSDTGPDWITRNFAVATSTGPPDTTPPDTTITSGPAEGSTITNNTPTFGFSSSETPSTFQCSVDSAAFTACTSPFTTAPLANGLHSFAVQAIDASGNVDPSPATRGFTVNVGPPPDTTPPETTITGGPAEGSTITTAQPQFSFTSTEAGTFECSVDGAAFVGCLTPFTTAPLASGTHSFRVRAIDTSGNIDASPATRNFTVDLSTPPPGPTPTPTPTPPDTTPPDTAITSGPAKRTHRHKATFSFAANEGGARFMCKVDGGAYRACTSPVKVVRAGPGRHKFYVEAIDAAGNVDPTPATYKWRVFPRR